MRLYKIYPETMTAMEADVMTTPAGMIPARGVERPETKQNRIHERFGSDDKVGDIDDTTPAGPKDPTTSSKYKKKPPESNTPLHKRAKGEIPMPTGLEPGYYRWSRRDEKAREDPNGKRLSDHYGRQRDC